MHIRSLHLSPLLLVLATGCLTGDDASEARGQATLHVGTVPDAVRCIEVVVSGESDIKRQVFAVPAGESQLELDLGELPLGSGWAGGYAYSSPCDGQSPPAEDPGWIADGQSVDIYAGVPADIELVFRRRSTGTGTVGFAETVVDIAVGPNATYAVSAEGRVFAWGTDYGGSLGDPVNTGAVVLTPLRMPDFYDVVDVEAGSDFACAIRDDRTVWCWGSNNAGQLGDGSTISRATPAQVPGLGNIVQLALGRYHSCAMNTLGETFCWGLNFYGQLGDSANQVEVSPRINGEHRVAIAAGGYHTCAVNTEGHLECTGSNSYGQLGTGDTNSVSYFTPLEEPGGLIDVAASMRNSCALRADGAVFCAGNNEHGQIGDGTNTQRTTPVPVGVSEATGIAISTRFGCAVIDDDQVSCWGDNEYGQLGDGTAESRNTAALVPGLQNVAQIAISDNHACAMTHAGHLYCWGQNDRGQIGDGTQATRFVPTEIRF
jgi:alpha-tubulin suppressor-like RCC1 family protein